VIATRVVVAALVVLGTWVGAPEAGAQEGTPDDVEWQSAGDSYSSGEGILNNSGACAQSDLAYGPQAAERLRAAGWGIDRTTFTACTGHLVEDYFNVRAGTGGKSSLWDWGREQGGPERVDVIAMSFGGNDVGFGDVVTRCLKESCSSLTDAELQRRADWLLDPGRRDCVSSRRESKEYECDLALSSSRGSIVDFYEQIVTDRMSDRGRLYVVGYPQLFADPSEWSWWEGRLCAGVRKDDTEKLNRAAQHLNGRLQEAVRRANEALGADRIVYVDRLAAFRSGGHELCGRGEDWMNGLTVYRGGRSLRYETSFHPNAAGHSATADQLVEQVRATFRGEASSEISDFGELSVEFVRRGLSSGSLSVLGRPEAVSEMREAVASAGDELASLDDAAVRLGDEFGELLVDYTGDDSKSCSFAGDISGLCVVVVESRSGAAPQRVFRVSWSLTRDGDDFDLVDGALQWPDGRAVESDELRPEVLQVELLPVGAENQGSTELVDNPTSFNSPSGNISCSIDARYARCDIRERTWAPPQESCTLGGSEDYSGGDPIELDYGNGLVIDSDGVPRFTCASDTVLGSHPVLDYGDSIESASVRCTSEQSGISCESLTTGQRFTISRDSYDLG
jgi:hypothetical protein